MILVAYILSVVAMVYFGVLILLELITWLAYYMYRRYFKNSAILNAMAAEISKAKSEGEQSGDAADDANVDIPLDIVRITSEEEIEELTKEEAKAIFLEIEDEAINTTFKYLLALTIGDAFANILYYISFTLVDRRYFRVTT